MTVSKNKQVVITRLKKEWRSGLRWSAYKNMGRIHSEEIKCFRSYSQATKFCETENKNCIGLPFKVCVITDFLKIMQAYAMKGRRQVPGEIAKAKLCEKYPAISFPLYTDHLPGISADAYFPVIWNRIINPLSDISDWLVLISHVPNKVMFSSKDHCAVLDYFMKQCGLIGTADSREELKLQAKIRDAAFDRYLELYRFYYHTRRACYILDKKIDGTKPFLLPITYFARYNPQLKRLVFFDENLKQVGAGKMIGEMDARYYATEIGFKII